MPAMRLSCGERRKELPWTADWELELEGSLRDEEGATDPSRTRDADISRFGTPCQEMEIDEIDQIRRH